MKSDPKQALSHAEKYAQWWQIEGDVDHQWPD
jgi:hypothetical protein